MAGGGSTGPDQAAPDNINYPTHMQEFHKFVLNDDGGYTNYMNVAEEMWLASDYGGGNPYGNVTPYDPDDVLERARDAFDRLKSKISLMSSRDDVDSDFDAAVAKVDANMNNTATKNSYLTEWQTREEARFQRSLSNTMLSLFFGGACVNTQFYMTLASVESEHADRVQEFTSQLDYQAYRDRNESILRLLAIYANEFQFELQEAARLAGAEFDLAKLWITAKQDEIDIGLNYDIQDSLWNLNLFPHGSAVLNSITGAAQMPRNPTEKERLMSGITNSLNMGLQVGMATQNPAIGALAAGISGIATFAGGR